MFFPIYLLGMMNVYEFDLNTNDFTYESGYLKRNPDEKISTGFTFDFFIVLFEFTI